MVCWPTARLAYWLAGCLAGRRHVEQTNIIMFLLHYFSDKLNVICVLWSCVMVFGGFWTSSIQDRIHQKRMRLENGKKWLIPKSPWNYENETKDGRKKGNGNLRFIRFLLEIKIRHRHRPSPSYNKYDGIGEKQIQFDSYSSCR